MPLIKTQWRTVDKTLCTFANICREDDLFIKGLAQSSGIIFDKNAARIPLSYFVFNSSLVARTILKALSGIGINEDIERKHISMIKNLANAENGTKIDLPGGTRAIKEYEYVTLTKEETKKINDSFTFKCGKTNIAGFGQILIKKTPNLAVTKNVHLIDVNSLPKNAKWRRREEGDVITKFGGGTKSLKAYLIEKKIPARLRDILPVLALGNEIFVVACVDISEKVKITKETTSAYAIEYVVE